MVAKIVCFSWNGTKERVTTKNSLAEHQQRYVCRNCKNTFWSSRKWTKYCSKECQQQSAYKRRKTEK